MSRSPSRTPPIHINPLFFSALAGLDDAAIASVMRISAHHVEAGRPMTVTEFGRGAGQDGLFLHALLHGVSHLLDPDALAAGDLVVVHVAEGLIHRAEIMAKRSEAANRRYVRAAAEQKAQGGEIKLTRGRVAGRRKGAAAAGIEEVVDQSVCTRVQNDGDYAHMYTDDACTHVHNGDEDAHVCKSDAHMCIGQNGTHVHKTALDAHMCIEDGAESASEYAHMCIPSADDDPETAENVGFRALDRSGGSSHVRAHPLRADLSISSHSSEKNKRVESVRGRGRYDEAEDEAVMIPGTSGIMPGAGRPRTAVATSNHDHRASRNDIIGSIPVTGPGHRSAEGPARSETPVPPEFVRRLIEAGPVDGDSARKKLAEWIDRWGEPFVRSGIEAIPNKELARPVSYLSSILTNLAKEAGDARAPVRKTAGAPQEPVEAASGPRMPRRVKRRITVPPGASWELAGWTARGHEGDAGPRRKQVWRTESGDLRYLDAPASDSIPTYEEDPGVYAYD